jgi:hypothetical protein
MGPYTKLSDTCFTRIYEATFNSAEGKLEIKYGQDNQSHTYDPKPYLIDGYYVATYCLPCEKTALENCFNSEPFISWKEQQLQIQN